MKNNSLRSNVAPQDDEQQTSQESHGHDESDAGHTDGSHDKDGHGHDHDEDGHDDGHGHDEGHSHGGDAATIDDWNDDIGLAMGHYLSPDKLIGHVQDSIPTPLIGQPICCRTTLKYHVLELFG